MCALIRNDVDITFHTFCMEMYYVLITLMTYKEIIFARCKFAYF